MNSRMRTAIKNFNYLTTFMQTRASMPNHLMRWQIWIWDLLNIAHQLPIKASDKPDIVKRRGNVQKSSSSKAAAILTRGAYTLYVSTAKGRERRWRLFSTFPSGKCTSQGLEASVLPNLHFLLGTRYRSLRVFCGIISYV